MTALVPSGEDFSPSFSTAQPMTTGIPTNFHNTTKLGTGSSEYVNTTPTYRQASFVTPPASHRRNAAEHSHGFATPTATADTGKGALVYEHAAPPAQPPTAITWGTPTGSSRKGNTGSTSGPWMPQNPTWHSFNFMGTGGGHKGNGGTRKGNSAWGTGAVRALGGFTAEAMP